MYKAVCLYAKTSWSEWFGKEGFGNTWLRSIRMSKKWKNETIMASVYDSGLSHPTEKVDDRKMSRTQTITLWKAHMIKESSLIYVITVESCSIYYKRSIKPLKPQVSQIRESTGVYETKANIWRNKCWFCSTKADSWQPRYLNCTQTSSTWLQIRTWMVPPESRFWISKPPTLVLKKSALHELHLSFDSHVFPLL